MEKEKNMLISIICTVLSLIASWIIFKKMGRQGWEGIIPIYNLYVLCEELYGEGIKFLFMLIPFYNIYFAIKLYVDWAKAFHKGTGFAIGMVFLPFIFQLILAFGDAQYGDGSRANNTEDFVSQIVDKTKDFAAGASSSASAPRAPKRDENALEKIVKLNEMKEQGIISEEEFQAKKAELMQKI